MTSRPRQYDAAMNPPPDNDRIVLSVGNCVCRPVLIFEKYAD
jgi:hypothetical protein